MSSLPRAALSYLQTWLEAPRRKPLVIRGARQVGKSTLVREFARSASLSLLEVNLEQHRRLESVFASFDVDAILREMEAIARTPPGPGTLLFLDEIQAAPSALAALRYLHEERPGQPVIAAGSLLEMVLLSPKFSMPVGRIEYLHLGPLSFSEFLTGLGDDDLVRASARWIPGEPWPAVAHQRLASRQREFLLVGGMPEAVFAFAAGEGFESVRRVHRSITATYRDDFAKYGASPTMLARLQNVFDYVPGALGQKIKYTNISRDDRSRELRAAIELLSLARVIWRVHHGDCSGVPLEARIDPHVFKLLFLDVGLASHMTGVDWRSLGTWDDRQLVHEGGLAEQFIGQHLLFRKGGLELPSLCYWLREGKSNNAEVDFVISSGRSIIPVEVKAGTAGSLRSVHQFLARGVGQIAPVVMRFDLNPPSLSEQEHRVSDERSVHYRLLSLPLYMVEQGERLLAHVLHS